METLKSLTENSAGYDVGKICRAKAVFPTTEEQNKGESRTGQEKRYQQLWKSPVPVQTYALHWAASGSFLICWNVRTTGRVGKGN